MCYQGVVVMCSSSACGDFLFFLAMTIQVPLRCTVLTWCLGRGVGAAHPAGGGAGGGGEQGILNHLPATSCDAFLRTPSCCLVCHLGVLSVPELLSPLRLTIPPCDPGGGFPHQYDSVTLPYFWKSSKFLSINSTHSCFQALL